MTAPGGVEVGRVSVRAVPDTAKFPVELKAALERIESKLRVELPVSLGKSDVVADARKLAKQAEAAAKVQLSTLLDTTTVTAQLAAVQRQVDARPIEVDLDVPARERAEVVGKVDSTKRGLERNPIRIPLDVDTSSLAAVSRQIATLGGTLAGAGVGAVAGQALAGGLLAIAAAVAETAGALALVPAAGAATVAVVGTLKLGLSGLEDALTADTPKKYAEALKEISPEARVLVQALRDLSPEVRAFRDTIQDRLLRGLSDDAKDLSDVYLPILKRGLGGIADELRAGALDLSRFAREARTLSVLRTTLDDSARATSLLREALHPAADAVRDLVDVGSDFLPGLAVQVAALAERWSILIERSADDGRLREWISQALDNIGDLAGIVGNIGRTFGAAFRAGDDEGRQLLDTVRGITGSIADFANSAEGQEALGGFFGAAGDLAEALLPLLRSVVSVVGTEVAPLLSRVGVTVVPALVRAVQAVDSALAKAGPGVETFAGGVAAVIDGLVDSGAIDAVGELAGVVGGELGDALERIGPKLGELVTAIADELAEAMPELVPAAADLTVALGDLLIAATPLIGVIASLVSTVGLPTLQRVAERLTPIIGDLAKEMADGRLQTAFVEVADAAADWVDEVAPLTDELIDLGTEIVRGVLPHLPDLIASSAELAETAVPLAKAINVVAAALAFTSEKIDDMTEKVPGLKSALGNEGLIGVLTSATTPLGPIRGLYDAVSGLTKIMMGEYPDATRSFVDNTVKLGEGSRITLDELRTGFEETFSTLLGLTTEHAPMLTDIFLGELFTMEDGSRTIFGQILADLTDHFGRMDAAVAEHTFGISDKVDAAWKRVSESTRREWEETERRVAEGIADVSAETSKLPARVRDSVGNIAGTLYPNGASLIQGFISGMKSQEYAARQAAEAVMRIVAGAFPSSPAKYGPFSGRGWTPYRGAALVEGFAEGMTGSISAAVRAAQQVTNAVSDRLPAPANGSSGAGGGVQLTQNIYPQPGQSEESIGMASSRHLAQIFRTR